MRNKFFDKNSDENSPYGLHWFRRDLRAVGNPALQWNCEKNRGRVLGVFCFDPKFLARPDFSYRRFGFSLETILTLKQELVSLGGDLLVLEGGPKEVFRELLDFLKTSKLDLPSEFSFNRDYEPYARECDHQVSYILEWEYGIKVHTERDHLLIEPDEISKPYKVYTPFKKQWLKLFYTDETQSRLIDLRPRKLKFALQWKDIKRPERLSDQLERFQKSTLGKIDVPLPKAGHTQALAVALEFKTHGLKTYLKNRDYPALSGTSKLSYYLKNGSLTTAQVITALNLGGKKYLPHPSAEKFLSELIWREFYYHVLWNFPHVDGSAFQEKYVGLKWENNEKLFKAWCLGKTGFPIVDAGMRELNETGWMHNRMRMIVASFLTKDLLIDWRWGEQYFMEKLLDGDLAANNGGWQWAASTGVDPQPYFRVFNPVLQGQKFDARGEYVRRFVPELRGVDAKEIHLPVRPVVDHAERKLRAIAMFRGKT